MWFLRWQSLQHQSFSELPGNKALAAEAQRNDKYTRLGETKLPKDAGKGAFLTPGAVFPDGEDVGNHVPHQPTGKAPLQPRTAVTHGGNLETTVSGKCSSI